METSKLYKWLDKKFERKDGKKDYCSCSPDVLFGVDIGKCCKYHDEDYHNKFMTRKECDKDFKRNIYNFFWAEDKRIKGFFVGWIYWIGVRLFAGKHY